MISGQSVADGQSVGESKFIYSSLVFVDTEVKINLQNSFCPSQISYLTNSLSLSMNRAPETINFLPVILPNVHWF